MITILEKSNEKQRDFFYGFLVPILLTIPFLIWPLDLKLESLFYDTVLKAWPYVKSFPWEFLYQYGHLLLIATILFSMIILVLSFFHDKYKKYRYPVLFYLTALAFGPGYLVNTTLKEYWGRPRPREIVEFGGTKQFLTPLQPGIPGNGQSFPSGHASTGFSFFALALALRQINRKWSRNTLLFALFFGLLMGLGRNVQGGHFPTDIIWAGAVCWLSAVFLYHYVFFRASDKKMSRRGKVITVLIVAAMVFQLFFLTAYYEEFSPEESLVLKNRRLTLASPGININNEYSDQGENIQITVRSQGFGATNVKLKEKRIVENNSIHLEYYFDRFILSHDSHVSVMIDTNKYIYSQDRPDEIEIHLK